MRRLPELLLVGLAGLAPACGTPAPAGPDAPRVEERPTWVLRTAAGSWRVRAFARPDPVPLNRPFELEVALEALDAAAGTTPWEAIELQVDATMPAHRHGMNRAPRVERAGPGRFVARGLLLHMAGEWLLTFDVTRAGITERAEVPLQLAPGGS